MARIFSILLILVYAFSATGATVHLHYCCGKLQKLAVHDEEKHDDANCPLCLKKTAKKKRAPCCTNDHCGKDQSARGHCHSVKIEAKKTTEAHLAGSGKNLAKIYPLELLVFTFAHLIGLPSDVRYTVQTADGGPPDIPVPLFIQHCTYRI